MPHFALLVPSSAATPTAMDGAFPSSLGEGGGTEEERRRGFRGTQENAKTKLCLRWKSGHCRFGDACNFAHGEEEIRQLPPRGFQGGGGGGGRGGRGAYGYDGYGQGGYGGGPQQMDQGGYYGGGGRGGGRMGQGGGSMPAYNEPRANEGRPVSGGNDVWAQQGFPVQGPGGWTQYTTLDTREQYYHNAISGETVWDKPREWQ